MNIFRVIFSDEAWFQKASGHFEGSQADPRLPAASSQDLRLPALLPRLHCSSSFQASAVQHHQAAEPLQEDHRKAQGATAQDREEEESGG